MSFNPPLGSTVSISSASDLVHFYYFGPQDEGVPEVWTDFPSGEWKAYQFSTPLNSLGLDTKIPLNVAIPLSKEHKISQDFKFTYRVSHPQGHVQWLGSDWNNGTISLITSDASISEYFVLQTFKAPLVAGKAGDVIDLSFNDITGTNWTSLSGIAFEKSHPSWFVPRTFHRENTESSIAVILQTTTHNTIILPLTTEGVSSSILYQNDRLILRCVLDSDGPPQNAPVVIGSQPLGSLDSLLQAASLTAQGNFDHYPLFPEQPLVNNDTLTFCTWNSLGPVYTLTDVINKLALLLNTPGSAGELYADALQCVLLDDGWQDTTPSENPNLPFLSNFECSSSWYSGSLQQAVEKIKQTGIRHVGVWITIVGHWGGFDPNSKELSTYGPYREYHLQGTTKGQLSLHFPKSSKKLRKLYSDYFHYLSDSGIEFIKIDDQSVLECLVPEDVEEDAMHPNQLKTELYQIIKEESNRVFGTGNVTHCMAGSTRLWGGRLAYAPKEGARDIIRNSDDYFPNDDNSHASHIGFNAHTALLSANFPNLLPDFDMAQENHMFGPFHIAFRGLQRAPVLTTDALFDGPLSSVGWASLLAKTAQGTRVIKPQNTGRVLESRIGSGIQDRVTWAFNKSKAGSVIGIWNGLNVDYDAVVTNEDIQSAIDVDDSKRRVIVPLSTMPSTEKLYKTQVISVDPSELKQRMSGHGITASPLGYLSVPPRDVAFLRVVPVFELPFGTSGLEGAGRVACLGLLGKVAGLDAITKPVVAPWKNKVFPNSPRGKLHGLLYHLLQSPLRILWTVLSQTIGRFFFRSRSLQSPKHAEDKENPSYVLSITTKYLGKIGYFYDLPSEAELELAIWVNQHRVHSHYMDFSREAVIFDLETYIARDFKGEKESAWKVDIAINRKQTVTENTPLLGNV